MVRLIHYRQGRVDLPVTMPKDACVRRKLHDATNNSAARCRIFEVTIISIILLVSRVVRAVAPSAAHGFQAESAIPVFGCVSAA